MAELRTSSDSIILGSRPGCGTWAWNHVSWASQWRGPQRMPHHSHHPTPTGPQIFCLVWPTQLKTHFSVNYVLYFSALFASAVDV